MATAYHVQVPPTDSGILKFAQTGSSAAKVSELLQKDLENHHVFFNASGFHNHIVHYLLTLYGTGAGPDILEKAYIHNASYQIHASQPSSEVVSELQAGFGANSPKYLGKGKHYADFLAFFQAEIDSKGWKAVLTQYLFRNDGDPMAHDLLGRLYAGFLHPMIQLMFGIEWQQPVIVAEALAQTAVHENKLGAFLEQAEGRANERDPPYRPLAEFFEELGSGEQHRKLATSAHWDDPNRIYDGVMKRAPDEALDLVSSIKVQPQDLDERTVEMLHTTAYVAAAAAWHPPHIPKFDFFLIHHLTSAPIFLTVNAQPWIPTSTKIRLLEWKMRLDVVEYVARGAPPLHPEILRTYSVPPGDHPRDLLPRFHDIVDDGHTIKVVRALLIAQEETRRFAGSPWVRIREEDWVRVHHLLLRGVMQGQSTQERWVRSAGFDEAWADVPKEE